MTTQRRGRPARPSRVPVSGNRDILTVDGKDDGYVYRWVNDQDNRIQKFEAAGYEHVDHDVHVGTSSAANQASTVGKTVSKNVGSGVTSHLMRVKREWYEEDRAVHDKQVDESEAAMKKQLNSGADGQYGTVTIK